MIQIAISRFSILILIIKLASPVNTNMSDSLDTETFFRLHLEALSGDLSKMARGVSKFVVPVPQASFLMNQILEVTKIFMNEDSLLEISAPTVPFVVVGDLHGHLFDLYRIIKTFGLPPLVSYLFLGDIVDRGEFSLETISLIYTLKILFPSNIFLIRGNHEFLSAASCGGLLQEIQKLYPGTEVFETFIKSFQYIPLAATIGKKILCLHGGLAPSLKEIEQIRSIERPVSTCENPVVCGLLWSDPSEQTEMYIPSPRGTGFLFGKRALFQFLSHNKLKMIIRGHECVKEGFRQNHESRILTVFSSSNYCGITGNQSAVLTISADLKVKVKYFMPLEYMKRDAAIYTVSPQQTMRKTIHMFIPKSQQNMIKNPPIHRGAFTMTATQARSIDRQLISLPGTQNHPSLVYSNIVDNNDNNDQKLPELTTSPPLLKSYSLNTTSSVINPNVHRMLKKITRKRPIQTNKDKMSILAPQVEEPSI